ncbi:acyl carrier protein, partial [Streptomyces sp. NPDC001219]
LLALTGLNPTTLHKAANTLPPLLHDLTPTTHHHTTNRTTHHHTTNQDTNPPLTQHLSTLPHEEREQTLLNLIRTQVATVLGHTDTNTIDPTHAFQDMGFDSLTAIELRNHLNNTTGLRLPTTLVFDHPNPTALATHLLRQIKVETVSPADSVIEELGRLRAAVQSAAADPSAYESVAGQLRELLDVAEQASGRTRADEVPPADDLDDASDEELFALLDELN